MGDLDKTKKVIAVLAALVALISASLGLYVQYYAPVDSSLSFEGVETEYVAFDGGAIEVELFLYNSGDRNAFVDYVNADAVFDEGSFEVKGGESYELVLEFDGGEGSRSEVVEVYYDDQKIEQEIKLRWGI
jgi:hypothetical protein